MAEKNPEESRDLKAFLEVEYGHYWDFLNHQYDVRDKYIQFFMLALAALGALLGVVLKEGDKNSEVVIVIMFALTLFGFLTFFKVLYQRKMTTESRQRLNGIRGRLLEMAGGGDDDLKKILYSTDPSTAKYLGGDLTVLGLLAPLSQPYLEGFSPPPSSFPTMQ